MEPLIDDWVEKTEVGGARQSLERWDRWRKSHI